MPAAAEIPPKPVGSYRILHTGDWHLGKMLNDQSRDEEHGLFLDWLLLAVAQHKIDVILLAGDVFDTANPPQSALCRYYDFVSALFRQGDCALVVISGNHDSAAQLEAPSQVLRALNTHVRGQLAEHPQDRILLLPDDHNPRVALALVPFLRDRDLRVGRAGEGHEEIRRQVTAGIQACYQQTAEAAADLPCPVVATGHLTVTGSSTSDSEREIHIGGLGSVTAETFPETFDYVALGHLHRPQKTDQQGRVRYAGSPIALSFSEAGDCKEVRLLDITEEQNIVQHSLPIPVHRSLTQIRTSYAELEQALQQFVPSPGTLRPWLEVVVEDATLQDDLAERVRQLTEDRDFDVLKVIRGRPETPTGMSLGEATDDEAIDSLLKRPEDVFEHLLCHHDKTFDDREIEQLKTTFAMLRELEQQARPVDTP